jgi:hypothetical protein
MAKNFKDSTNSKFSRWQFLGGNRCPRLRRFRCGIENRLPNKRPDLYGNEAEEDEHRRN